MQCPEKERVRSCGGVAAVVELRSGMSIARCLVVVFLIVSGLTVMGEAYLFSLLLSNPMVEPQEDVYTSNDSADLRSSGGSVSERGLRAGGRSHSDAVSAAARRSDGDRSRPDPGRKLRSGDTMRRAGGERRRGVGRSHERRSQGAQERDTGVDIALQLAVEVSAGERRPPRADSAAECSADRQCGRGHFCALAEGTCRRRLRAGGACSRDGECRGRSGNCQQGRCSRKHHKQQHKQSAAEPSGGGCRNDADCDASSCCARLHSGGTACRARTPLGHRCRATPANLPVPLYDTCPCEAGTQCKYIHRPGEDWTLWTAYDNLRCIRDSPNASTTPNRTV